MANTLWFSLCTNGSLSLHTAAVRFTERILLGPPVMLGKLAARVCVLLEGTGMQSYSPRPPAVFRAGPSAPAWLLLRGLDPSPGCSWDF